MSDEDIQPVDPLPAGIPVQIVDTEKIPVHILNTDWKGIALAAFLSGLTSAFTVLATLDLNRRREEWKQDREDLYDLYTALMGMSGTLRAVYRDHVRVAPTSAHVFEVRKELDRWLATRVPRENSVAGLITRTVDYRAQSIEGWQHFKSRWEWHQLVNERQDEIIEALRPALSEALDTTKFFLSASSSLGGWWARRSRKKALSRQYEKLKAEKDAAILTAPDDAEQAETVE